MIMYPHIHDMVQDWQNPRTRGIDDIEPFAKGLNMDTKTELLDSAERAARERGYDGFSYADIAEEVGIRKASIHYHYPAKSDLGLALIQRYREGLRMQLDDITASAISAGAKLQAYLKFYRGAMADGNTVCLCVAFAISRDNLADPILAELDQFHDDSIEWLSTIYADAVNDKSIMDVGKPAQEAASTLALVEGAQLIARSSKNMKRFDAAVKQLKARII